MRRWVATIAGAAALALLVTAWLLLAPTQIGGQATYVMTEGVSMLPTYHTGDLVILRRESSYDVGDAVAYVDPTIGQIFHRIVGRDGDRFVMKGDNNGHLDSFRPRVSDILGKLWIYVPSGASLVKTARQPAVAAGLVGGAALLAAVPVRRASRVRRRFFHRASRPGRRSEPPQSASVLGPAGQFVAMLAVSLALVSGLGAVVAFSQPAERTNTASIDYTQSGSFAYAVSGAPSTVYDAGSIGTGDPVYRKLTPRVSVSFDYTLAAADATSPQGTASLDAILSADNGWKRTFPLEASTAFQGTTAHVSGTVDLDKLTAAIVAYEKATGLNVPTYSLVVAPKIELTGSMSGAALHLVYTPTVKLTYDGEQLSLPSSDNDPVHPKADGTVTHNVTVPNSISLLVLSPRVEAIRTVSIAGLALAALVLLGLLALALRAARASEIVKIEGRYSPLLVALSGSDLGSQGRIFEVATIEDLVRVAEREARMILHETQGSVHSYYVQDAEVTYRYRVVDEAQQAATQEATP